MQYIFANCELDTLRGVIRNGEREATVAEKPFEVLCYLLQHANRSVSRQELAERFWSKVPNEATILRTIRTLRRGIGDNLRNPRIIQYDAKLGYRIAVPITVVKDEAGEAHQTETNAWSKKAIKTIPKDTITAAPNESLQIAFQSTMPESSTGVIQSSLAERRQLTVMFCDVVGSTELAGQLDPEDFREVMLRYQTMCAETIERYGGHIAQYLGDGLLVYFGYPQSYEDAAQRAIHAGLGIVADVAQLTPQLRRDFDINLSVRIGIHTGLVVVGEMSGGPQYGNLALGATPNLAAKIQDKAQPNSVAISSVTAALADGYFEWQSLGEHALPGVGEPMSLYQVLQASDAQHRLDVARPHGLTPLVGREHEIGLLMEKWERVQEGQGHVVVLRGEAGIGKSRLAEALKEHVASVEHTMLECRSSPYYQNTALYPITVLLQRAMEWEADDAAEAKLLKLEEILGRCRFSLAETMPLFAKLMSLPLPEDRYAPLDLPLQQQRQNMLETLVTMLVEESEHQPMFFIIEDLHWTDPTTLEFLDLLIDQSATASIFTLLTCRSEFQLPWSRRSHWAEMSLSRLSQRQTEQMAEGVANGKRLPDEVVRELVEKTDGVPLYLEEMTKAVIESGALKEHDDHYELTGSTASLVIPATLHDSLTARLDRLELGKGVAQLAAVIGREFSYVLIQAVADLDETTLH